MAVTVHRFAFGFRRDNYLLSPWLTVRIKVDLVSTFNAVVESATSSLSVLGTETPTVTPQLCLLFPVDGRSASSAGEDTSAPLHLTSETCFSIDYRK